MQKKDSDKKTQSQMLEDIINDYRSMLSDPGIDKAIKPHIRAQEKIFIKERDSALSKEKTKSSELLKVEKALKECWFIKEEGNCSPHTMVFC